MDERHCRWHTTPPPTNSQLECSHPRADATSNAGYFHHVYLFICSPSARRDRDQWQQHGVMVMDAPMPRVYACWSMWLQFEQHLRGVEQVMIEWILWQPIVSLGSVKCKCLSKNVSLSFVLPFPFQCDSCEQMWTLFSGCSSSLLCVTGEAEVVLFGSRRLRDVSTLLPK